MYSFSKLNFNSAAVSIKLDVGISKLISEISFPENGKMQINVSLFSAF